MAAKHRGPDEPGDTPTRRPKPPGKPYRERRSAEPRRKPSYRRIPVEVTSRVPEEHTRDVPVIRPTRSVGRAAPRPPLETRRGRRDRHAAVVGDAGAEYARRAAIRATAGGRPSTTGRALSGAAGGAATGAALGSVVPGIGTAVGAGAGAALGGTGGAISGRRAKREHRAALRAHTTGPRRLLLVEFAVCTAVVALSPLTDKDLKEKPGSWMTRMTAVLGLFFVLALLSAGGRSMAKVAAGFGGLVTVVLLVSERSLFSKLAGVFSAPGADRGGSLTSGPVGDPDEPKAAKKAEKAGDASMGGA